MKNSKKAFSLVEILVALIIVSLITAALAPVITKKLSSSGVTITGGGSNAQEIVTMMCANMFGDANCVQCSKDNCIKCSNEYYLTPEYVCSSCNVGYFCDGSSSTMPCSNKYGAGCTSCNSAKCLVVDNGYFINEDGISTPCYSQYDINCALCNSTKCNACKGGYAFDSDGITCKATCLAGSEEFTAAGEYEFNTPVGCTEITVTLVSGGSGGAGGSVKLTDANFSTTNSSWTVPSFLKGRPFKLYAIGGGGGAGGNPASETAGHGGYGGMVNGAIATFTTNSTIAIYVGSGGARGSRDNPGSGGGATYLSTHSNNASLVAGGGGGGGSWYGNGSAGGGAETSNGGSGGYRCPGDGVNAGSGANGKPAMDTTTRNTVFGSVTYGNRGTHGSGSYALGTAGSNGYLRITYVGENVGGSGGAGGFIVPKQVLNVNPASEKLKVVIGAGGAGGNAVVFKDNDDLFTQATGGALGGQSRILRGAVPVLQTLISDGIYGAGGKINGEAATAAYLTNGLNSTAIGVDNFVTTGSTSTTTVYGTTGGTVTIDGIQFCQGGIGGSSNAGGTSATTFGGCGGGGGAPGYAGGKGADGYARIEWGSI